MRRLGVFVISLLIFTGFFSTTGLVSAQNADRLVDKANAGTYDYFLAQTASVFSATFQALDTLKTATQKLPDGTDKTQKLAALDQNVQTLTSLQNIYFQEFTTGQNNALQPAQTQLNALNKTVGAWSTAFTGIPRIAEQQSILTGSNGTGGGLHGLNDLITQAKQIQNGTITAGSDAASSLNNATAISTSGTSAATAVTPGTKDECGIIKGSITNCIDSGIAWIIKNTLLQIAGFLVWVSANMMNYAIQVSVLGFSKWAPDSLYPIWLVVRQIISLVVVFAGLYLGFMYIIGKEETFTKYVGWLVIFALFVNFSYPVTRTLTDISNVISLNVYASAVGSEPLTTDFSNAATALGQNTPGALIMTRLGLYGLVGSATNVSTSQSGFVNSLNSTPAALLAVVFVLYAAYIFFKATAIIVGRAAALVFIIIASPILLIDSVVPKLGEAAMKVRKIFFEQLIVAPVFMIMLALTLKFMEVFGTISQVSGNSFTGGGASIQTFFNITMMLVMLHIMLKVTTYFAGEVGQFATNALGKVGGFGLAAATAGTGVLARGSLGAAAARWRDSDWMKNAQASRMGRGLYTLSNSLAQSTFDARNVGLVSKGLATAGITGGMGLSMQTGLKQNYDERYKTQKETTRAKLNYINSAEKKKAGVADSYLTQTTRNPTELGQRALFMRSDAQKIRDEFQKDKIKAKDKYDKINDQDKKQEYFDSLPKDIQDYIKSNSTQSVPGSASPATSTPSSVQTSSPNLDTSSLDAAGLVPNSPSSTSTPPSSVGGINKTQDGKYSFNGTSYGSYSEALAAQRVHKQNQNLGNTTPNLRSQNSPSTNQTGTSTQPQAATI